MSERKPTGDVWDPQQYNRFREERRQPFLDLLGLVKRPLGQGNAATVQVADLGCGTGELSRLMFDQLQRDSQSRMQMLALDSSPAMLRDSAAYACAGLEFRQASFESFATAMLPGQPDDSAWDLIFSNAALQYAENHAKLFPALCAKLAPGGQLAVQMPCNDHHPAYCLAHEIAAEPRFANALGGYVRQTPVQQPEWYADLLFKHGLTGINVRVQVYSHVLAEAALVTEWVKGTLLNNYTKRLDAATAADYLAEYACRLPRLLGAVKPYLFTFNRIFIYGVRP